METCVARSSSSRKYWSTEDIRAQVSASPVVVFAKGTKEHPRCGFSERVFRAVESCGAPFKTVDICEDTSIAAALRVYSGQRALPSVFANGELVASSDELVRIVATGEFTDRLKKALSQ